jgi:Flp pilus assembly protein TadG
MTCGLQHESDKQRAHIRPVVRPRERGSSLVEQSFVIVFLLTMMLGIIDFGRALYTYHFVSNVAREATRWASVRSVKCDSSALGANCTATASPSGGTVQSTFRANLSTMGLDPTKVKFVTTYAAPPSIGATSCPAATNLPGCMVHVDVTYSFTFIFASFIAVPAVSMNSSSEMLITQ